MPSLAALAVTLSLGVVHVSTGSTTVAAAPNAPPVAPPVAPPGAGAAAPGPAATTSAPKVVKPVPARIEVIELGDEPRRSLRAGVPVGQVERIKLSIEPLVNRFIDGDALVLEKPVPLEFVLDLRVREARADGGRTVEAVVREASHLIDPAHDAAQLAQIDGALAVLRGGGIEVDLDQRGAAVEVRVPPELWPDDARGAVVQRVVDGIVRLFTPTPDDQLGVGGRWRVLFDDPDAPIAVREMLVMRVVSLTRAPDTVPGGASTATIERYALWTPLRSSQRVRDGVLPGGEDAVLTSLSGRGGGSMTLATDRIAPRQLDDQLYVGFFVDGRDARDGGRRQLHEQRMIRTSASAAPPASAPVAPAPAARP
ncbi:MAG: hypothetical protein U0575_14400 [Phycisphaerales bacterium]